MDPTLQPYSPSRLAEVVTIWHECGWIDAHDDGHRSALETFCGVGRSEVALVDGRAEAHVHRTPGTIRHLDTDLPFCAITAVATSRVGRRRGLASTLTALALARGADEGGVVAGLGIFEQGFYDRLGFGSGPYEHRLTFDPSALRLPDRPVRHPVRLGPDDHEAMHAALVGRARRHGAVTLGPAALVRAELGFLENLWALGLPDDAGRLSAFVAGRAKGERGPYTVDWIAYRDGDELLDLLHLLRSLGDQVNTVEMIEPPEVQLQDLLDRPLRRYDLSEGRSQRALAWWQIRVLDVPAAVAAVDWEGTPVRFVADITDPVTHHLGRAADLLDASAPPPRWHGVAGRYRVELGRASSAQLLADTASPPSGLPVLTASVGAFSRLLFGVRPASTLAVCDDLTAPPDLLARLDRALALSTPHPGWDF
ncbi:MAG: GNAT family N-acetyltransferase [Actinomyces sp.]|nr:MAG: GNAT family N-acetyltransferase [Actinomyces sp.]